MLMTMTMIINFIKKHRLKCIKLNFYWMVIFFGNDLVITVVITTLVLKTTI
jgi:hypothetical protein